MPSMKAKKGNPFEKDVAYSLSEGMYSIYRPDDNLPGIDLVSEKHGKKIFIECKNHKRMTWNQLKKIFEKTSETLSKYGLSHYDRRVVFHTNRQPVLVFWKPAGRDYMITTFEDAFNCEFRKRPKGYRSPILQKSIE